MTLSRSTAAPETGGRRLAVGLVAAAAGVLLAACSFDSTLSGAECDREDALSEDGSKRCRNGFWIALDGSAQPGDSDTGMPPIDTTNGGDTEPPGGDGACEPEPVWYRDSDGDGWGTDDETRSSCTEPEGFAGRSGDCDDGNSAVNPGASESCDGVDEDCDGDTDENKQGDPLTEECGPEKTAGICERVTRTCANGSWDDPDCDGATYPRTETCDTVDNDCDGDVDETGCKNFKEQCGADEECASGKCSASTCAQTIFVTRSTYQGKLGETSGADQKCNDAASAANLGGDWIAVVSDSDRGARSRIDVQFPLYNRDGDPVATSQNDLWDLNSPPALENEILYDQYGDPHPADVWTGTGIDGDGNNYCSDDNAWDTTDAGGTVGRSDATDGTWLNATGDQSCSKQAALYCIEKK